MVQILFVFLCYAALLALGKAVFVIYVGGYTFTETLQVMVHGLPMDMTIAGYLTIIPALLTIALLWIDPHWKNAPAWALNPPRSGMEPTGATSAVRMAVKIYFWISAALITFGVVLNAALYPYWKFPLDYTPLFYFFSSPKSALASVTFWQVTGASVTVALMLCLCKKALAVSYNLGKGVLMPRNRIAGTVCLVLATVVLFIPIRGGVTVSTMNPSRAYFSKDMRLNHAAMDPLFSLMYSMSHADDFQSQFRFMDDAEAIRIFDGLDVAATDSMPSALASPIPFKPHIQLIILESFSSHLMPSLGGEPIAVRLDSIAREGLLFTDIYASSFRTDRALPAILNGYPAQPTASIMKYVSKLDSLPAIASSLRDAEYSTEYYYGGDVNFTNMNALLVAGGFDRIVSDKDFPVSQRLSKWGAQDEAVFARALADSRRSEGRPRFTVVQTSSSHEPYDVPFASRHADKAANAFAYADSCLGAYIDSLKLTASYDSTLIVIVPDHYGSYPHDIDDHRQRHRVPLVITGGAAKHIVADPAVLNRAGSQTDIAATILELAGVDASKFRFSHNLLDPSRPDAAFFSEPSWIAVTDGERFAEIDVPTLQPADGAHPELLTLLKAYYQYLYRDISRR